MEKIFASCPEIRTGRCVFHVYANEPIDATKWEFTMENELPHHKRT